MWGTPAPPFDRCEAYDEVVADAFASDRCVRLRTLAQVSHPGFRVTARVRLDANAPVGSWLTFAGDEAAVVAAARQRDEIPYWLAHAYAELIVVAEDDSARSLWRDGPQPGDGLLADLRHLVLHERVHALLEAFGLGNETEAEARQRTQEVCLALRGGCPERSRPLYAAAVADIATANYEPEAFEGVSAVLASEPFRAVGTLSVRFVTVLAARRLGRFDTSEAYRRLCRLAGSERAERPTVVPFHSEALRPAAFG